MCLHGLLALILQGCFAEQGLFEPPVPAGGLDVGAISAPEFPLQFSGTIETVALLLDKNIDYPPRVKRYDVHYDWVNKISKVAVTAGEEWDEYVMRYDQDMEHHIEMEGKQRKCYVSELKVKMPLPEKLKFPRYKGTKSVRGTVCHHWTDGKGDSKVDYFETVENRHPLQLLTPAMSYDFVKFQPGPPDLAVFDINSRQCEEQVGGFPYVHIWHYFIRT
jgi:hypothetical protein